MSGRLHAGHSSLGLVIAVAALAMLPQPLVLVTQLLTLDDWSMGMIAMPLLMVGGVVLLLAAGCAMAWRSVAAWPLMIGSVASTIAIVIYVLPEMGGDVDGLALVGMVLEVVGLPLVALIAMLAVRPGEGASRRSEAGALLLVLGVTGLVGTAVNFVEQIRIWTTIHGDVPPSAIAWTLVTAAVFIVVELLAVRAALLLHRGAGDRAMRALALYAITAIAAHATYTAFQAGFILLDRHDFPRSWIVTQLAMLAVSIAKPLVIWMHARSEPVESSATIATAPAWNALLVVPFLLARPFITGELEATYGAFAITIAVLFATQGIATALAAAAALRQRIATVPLAALAAALGIASTSAVVILTSIEANAETGPFVAIAVNCAVLAWLHRTAAKPLPVMRTR